MLINMRNGLTTGKRLPYDAEVEYLQFSAEGSGASGCFVDTGIVPNGSQSLTIVFSDFTSKGRWLLGSRIGAQNNAYGFYANTNSLNFFTAYGVNVWQGPGAFATSNVGKVTFKMEANVFSAAQELGSETSSHEFNAQTISSGKNLVLGGLNNNGSVISFSTFKFYGAIIAGLRDFIPVRFTNKQGVSEGAMYDRANPTVGMDPDGSARTDGLYRNRGTGAFGYGNDI